MNTLIPENYSNQLQSEINMSMHITNITNTDFLRLLLQTDLKYRDSYWVLQTREHLAKMSEITGRRLSREESIVNEVEERLKSETT
jgi:hypothetical protein